MTRNSLHFLLVRQALHEALMRQEELLAYVERQHEAKLRVCVAGFSFLLLSISSIVVTKIVHILLPSDNCEVL